MANLKVSIYEQRKREDGKWTLTPIDPKLIAKPKLTLKEDYRSRFLITWYEGTRKRYQRVKGETVSSAKSAAEFKTWQLAGAAKGVVVEDPSEARLTIAAAKDTYLAEIEHSRRPETHLLQKQTLEQFTAWCKHIYMDEITRLDLLRYKTWLVKEGNAVRTACNKVGRLSQFHRYINKLDPGKGLITTKDLKFTEEMVSAYSQEELDKFFAACTEAQHLLFTTFLQSGCRMQELMFLTWGNLDFEREVLQVRANPEHGFTVKDSEEREIPLPSDLAARLKKVMESKKAPEGEKAQESIKHELVFPTRSGKPNWKWLDQCKAIAKKAGMNPEDWFLHKFRATMATTYLRKGTTLVDVQHLLGHSTLESTMRYLAPLRSDQLRSQVNAVWTTGK